MSGDKLTEAKKMDNKLNESGGCDVKNEVMREIREKKIKMKSPGVFLAEKLGLESALLASLLFGAFLVSVTFYLFKKTGILKFLSLGTPGFKVFFIALPYGYIVLFFLSIILAIYFANKLNIPCSTNTPCNQIGLYFFLACVVVGAVFTYLGAHRFYADLSRHRIPKDRAIWGKVKGMSGQDLILEDEDGNLVRLCANKEMRWEREMEDMREKYMRAVGFPDRDDQSCFWAEQTLCCDEE